MDGEARIGTVWSDEELGLPWIPGYKPKRNYQAAILGAIERYLAHHPALLEIVPASPLVPALAQVFVEPPLAVAATQDHIRAAIPCSSAPSALA